MTPVLCRYNRTCIYPVAIYACTRAYDHMCVQCVLCMRACVRVGAREIVRSCVHARALHPVSTVVAVSNVTNHAFP